MAQRALRSEAIVHLARYVFLKDSELKPQGFARRAHVDYWGRFLAVPTLREDERDQPVLRVLLSDNDGALLDLLETKRSATVENFARLVPTERLLRMLVSVVERRSREMASAWPQTDEPPGLVPLWRMLLRRSESGSLQADEMLARISQCYEVAVPRNLALAASIENYFVIPEPLHNLLRADESLPRKAKEHFRQLMRRTFTGRPSELSRALSGGSPWVLGWAVWGLDRIRSRDYTGLPFDGWGSLAETILDAASENPTVMIPQLAGLLGHSGHVMGERGPEQRWEFDRDLTARLFGSAKRVLDVFRKADLSKWADNKAVTAVARELERAEE